MTQPAPHPHAPPSHDDGSFPPPYAPRMEAESAWLPVRGLKMHLHRWHAQALNAPAAGTAPLRVMLHGFMDVGASFQFVVDAMPRALPTVAPDWRGFGRTAPLPGSDTYVFSDYLGDLDRLLDALSPGAPVDLIGHSMGGNIAMAYAGLRPARVRRLVNLEGFGLPDMSPTEAMHRLQQWMDSLAHPPGLRPYASQAEVARRMQRQNPRLTADKAAWLAAHWAEPTPDGTWALRADPAHRRPFPVAHRAAETEAMWSSIAAPVLFLQGSASGPEQYWAGRYTQSMMKQRLARVPDLEHRVVDDAGHMLHHDQPEAVARAIDAFLSAPTTAVRTSTEPAPPAPASPTSAR